MARPTRAYYEAAVRLAEERLDPLRSLAHEKALALPEVQRENLMVAGERASFTLFRYLNSPHLQGSVLVVARVARPRWFGMAAHHTDRGLVFSLNAPSRNATALEMQNTGA
jgi:hypothetical protein